MKSFQEFQEDLNQLQQDLDTISKKRSAKERLAARTKIAKEKSKLVGSEFNQRSAEEIAAQKERLNKKES